MKHPGWPIIIALTIIPLFLWITMIPVGLRFSNLGAISTSIGQLSGIIGMVLFSIAMILSTRLKLFDTLFGGLNRAYIVHHQVGGIAFILLMIHPISLAGIYLLSSVQSAALFLLPGQNWVNNFGIASLLLLMGLLIFTYYIDLPYEFWRFTHKFLGVSFLFGAIHTFFTPSDVSINPLLRIYMFTLIGVGLICYVYRTLLGRWLVHRLRYTVYKTRRIGDTVELILVPDTNEVLHFSAGQFMFVQFLGQGISHETHPFSISSAPNINGFEIAAKILGDFTETIGNIPPGTKALIEGPFGRFSPVYVRSQSYVWVAGGIGITPFLSMARALTSGDPIDLYYVVRSPEEAIFLPELLTIAKEHPTLRIIPWYTKQNGHLTSEHFLKNTTQLKERKIFVCGPPAMMKGTKKELRKAGVSSSNIHSEEFSMS